ncbi:tRNA uracil 4-sulfurtransferase ThiI [Peloplasma aerotolerans]|uniref:Probable tRNA sulfurtransferase n=1 Tax=Peloplasma aerotolerans TaxID=3044389 RepID=A0AAW6U4X3_9MOLU|nr:tRNA uracil 4-sulfurtransferase ThiI [Mariniplasma sp. M4Ah]MDI6452932.1 tRNA uracil 4-sulfurtransferase ThiI [Mariniplasma sp. M4Ah]
MKKKILIRFGDMMLKGKNIGFFIKRVRTHMIAKLKDLNVKYEFTHDRIYISFDQQEENEILRRLKQIQGINSFSVVQVSKPEIDDIVEKAIHVLDTEIKHDLLSIKIETKRADKNFPMTSQEITQTVAGRILKAAQRKFIVDVKSPDETLYIELRKDAAYIYLKSIKGMGGFPYGVAGKGLLMMSGGIDSPVAGYLAMKQGVEIELFHFESTPLTPLESVQKVIDLAKKLSVFTPSGSIKLHLVPFTKTHEEILAQVTDPYIITIMRRMMYRLAESYANRNKIICLINGESIGQVASQTLQGMKAVEAVTKTPILRPVITYDKQEIVNIAKDIETFDVSIRPFNDCCSIYVPKNPATKPRESYALKYERYVNYEELLEQALNQVRTLDITSDFNMDITQLGFTVDEAFNTYFKEKSDEIDHIETK